MLDFYFEVEAECTVAALPVPVAEARAFGVLEVDESWRVLSFTEKPEVPREIPGRPGWALASMGNYIFNTKSLVAELLRDAEGKLGSQHDFGRNILPDMVGQRRLYAYDFLRNAIPGMDERERGYWRDVGTIQQYFLANMDLIQVVPVFNLYNPRWPMHTWMRPLPPAKFVFDEEGPNGLRRVGFATNSLVSEGCIVSGGHVSESVLGPRVRVSVEDGEVAWWTDQAEPVASVSGLRLAVTPLDAPDRPMMHFLLQAREVRAHGDVLVAPLRLETLDTGDQRIMLEMMAGQRPQG